MKDKIVQPRRSFLQGAAIAGAVVSLPLSASAALQPLLDKVQSTEFSMPDFESITGQTVSIRTAQGTTHKGVISEVQNIEFQCSTHSRPTYLRAHSKVVRFNVVDADTIVSDLHQVKMPQLGKMDMLLTVVPDADGVMGLEAVFN